MTRVGTGAILFSADRHRVLLLHHTKSGHWTRPGGAVEAGETAEAACRRELEEEVGLGSDAVADLRSLDVQEGAKLSPATPWVAMGFVGRVSAPHEATACNKEPHKHGAVSWLPVEAVLSRAAVTAAGDGAPRDPSLLEADAAPGASGPLPMDAFTVASLRTAVSQLPTPSADE
jgi:8-oxo-dGTP pyrophosphatase MutT (NUDIX family)